MNNQNKRVVLAGALRLPFMKMNSDLAELDLLDLLSINLEAAVEKFRLSGQTLGEVALGATFFHPRYWNVCRDAVLKSTLARNTPAMALQRACATSLEAAISVANKIALGKIASGIAGGAESMSNIALFLKPALARRMVKNSKAKSIGEKLAIWKGLHFSDILPMSAPGVELSTGKSMGQHCELMAKQWKISRQEQDELALKSHQTGIAAFKSGFYDDLVIDYKGKKQDNNLRGDTSVEKLAKLKPAFDFSPAGTLTAGNSSPFTDGAACVVLGTEEWAKERGLEVLAYVRDYETAAIDPFEEGLLMAPAYAMPKLLKRNNLKLQDFDFYEIHEAFTAQVLCTLKAWENPEFCKTKLGLDAPLGSIDRAKLNTVGGSVALGHPFGATGARIMGSLGKLLHAKGSGRGVISICTGGGMGTVMILEK